MIKVHYNVENGEIVGFYPDDVSYKSIPEPNIEIDEDTWKDCLNNQNNRIVDIANRKIIAGTVTPTDGEKRAAYYAKRDALLTATDQIYSCDDYTVSRQPLTSDQRTELKTYRQALREAPEKSYPDWPAKPSWL